MSVIRPKTVQTYTAPVAVSADDISLSGSWTTPVVTSDVLCRYTIQSWQQKLKHETVDIQVDYCVFKVLQGYKFAVELHICYQQDFGPYISQTSDTIQRILRQSKAKSISNLFQQEQPGASFGVSETGNAGKDGVIQSV